MRKKLAFVASRGPKAREARDDLVARYGQVPEAEADVIVALGGDGFMLATLHRTQALHAPVYGMNRGTVGFLMNEYHDVDLMERVAAAEVALINPLAMRATRADGKVTEALAINEVSLLRAGPQAAKLKITVDGKVRMEELVCDGALLATPAGSTAYNLSAHGPILPIGAGLLALTPVSAFRPRRWKGALLRRDAHVRIDVIAPILRPVAAAADNQEVRDIAHITVTEDRSKPLTMLFDPGHALDERILREQFSF